MRTPAFDKALAAWEATHGATEDYEAEEKRLEAIRVLSDYSHFVMACIGEGVTPHQLRVHLIKEISGMPTSLEAHRAHVAQKGKVASSSSSEATSSIMELKPLEPPRLPERGFAKN